MNNCNIKLKTILSYCSEKKNTQASLSRKCLSHDFLKDSVHEIENHYSYKLKKTIAMKVNKILTIFSPNHCVI